MLPVKHHHNYRHHNHNQHHHHITTIINNSERPVDALAVKKVNDSLTDNLKSRDASASKNIRKQEMYKSLSLFHSQGPTLCTYDDFKV